MSEFDNEKAMTEHFIRRALADYLDCMEDAETMIKMHNAIWSDVQPIFTMGEFNEAMYGINPRTIASAIMYTHFTFDDTYFQFDYEEESCVSFSPEHVRNFVDLERIVDGILEGEVPETIVPEKFKKLRKKLDEWRELSENSED